MDKNYKTLLIYTVLCASCIFIYGKIRCSYNNSFKDPLQYSLNIWDLDGWSIAHMMFFMLLGYKMPNMFWPAMACGVVWEGFESWYGTYQPDFLKGWGHCVTTDPEVEGTVWWYGKMSDIVMNTIGFVVGMQLALRKN